MTTNKTYKANQLSRDNEKNSNHNTVEFRPTDPANLADNPQRMWVNTQEGAVKYSVDGVTKVELIKNSDIDTFISSKADKTYVDAQLADNVKDITSVKKSSTSIKTMFTFINDDNRIEAYNSFKPLTEQYGVRFTNAVITGKVGLGSTNMDLAQFKTLQGLGWEMISHTQNHEYLSLIDDAQLSATLRDSYNWLVDNGFNGDFLVYPYGYYNSRVIKETMKYYKGAFRAEQGERNLPPLKDNFNIVRGLIGLDAEPPYNTLTYYKSLVDDAIANNSWMVWCLHADQFDATQLGYLEQLIIYIQSLGYDISTVSEGFEVFGNRIENYDFISDTQHNVGGIAADGTLFSSTYGKVKLKSAEIDIGQKSNITKDTPITFFPYGNHRLSIIADNYTHSFPTSNGILETFRATEEYKDDGIAFQVFSSITTAKAWKRTWNKTTNLWNDFVELYPADYKLKLADAIASSVKPSELERGKSISHTTTTFANAQGYPLAIGGLLISERANSGDAVYSKQSYKVYGSDRTFTRTAIDANTWSAWLEQNIVKQLTSDSLASTTLPNALPTGVSYCQIAGGYATAQNYPLKIAGLLIIERIYSGNGYAKQTYKPNASNRIFVRSGLDNNTWDSWYEVGMTLATWS